MRRVAVQTTAGSPFNNDLTMTNAELLAKIKAEIERRTKELDEQIVDIYDSKAVLRKDELQKLLSFLSTLESEKPMNLGERIGSYNIVPYIDDKIGEKKKLLLIGTICTK